MGCFQVFFHPALITDLYRIVGIPLQVRYCGSTADKFISRRGKGKFGAICRPFAVSCISTRVFSMPPAIRIFFLNY